MKKTYISPVVVEVILNYHQNLLAGSLIDDGGVAEIIDDGGGIVDTGGILDPDAHVYDFDFEDISEAQDY